jgi:hypothetical protein
MESDFASAIGRWQSFQSLAGAVAATLLGLLFVAVSIRPTLVGRQDHPDILSIAAKSMGLFMLVILIALVSQIPDLRPSGMAIGLVIIAVMSLANTGYQIAVMRRILDEWGPLFFVRRILLPTAGYVILLVTSVAIYHGDDRWLLALGTTQILFLFTGTYNAWDLLIHPGSV